ncbi:hypothetical protein SAMN02745163_04363 [Clostridium cavendishii DSM 21758]|uniref:Uncharacterized protein n=1 Tax=Clostridium cavendishii DSM 21758 TaxID=1121302 RepID=A0A1M6UVI1_9CLOT|nr:hypothetical protein [Clostridium cavendishii]SHK73250.1 hypothetical protein SAMN02745163_04363 [Clostridium cavendishii DSM 21758]
MKKRFQYFMLIISLIGYLFFCLSKIFRNDLSDFTLGFCEGSSVVFIVSWGIYMILCLVKGKNPYKIDK